MDDVNTAQVGFCKNMRVQIHIINLIHKLILLFPQKGNDYKKDCFLMQHECRILYFCMDNV